jgi:hypothetical protein
LIRLGPESIDKQIAQGYELEIGLGTRDAGNMKLTPIACSPTKTAAPA